MEQQELPLPFPELARDLPLLPARMVNEYAYCPRLAYLEWVQGEWDSSADTVQGAHVHRRVDKPGPNLPEAEDLGEEDRLHTRSIELSSNKLGLIARLDLVEAEDGHVVPVDYKRGKRPHVAKGAYDPERVQLCLQGLLLREHGYRCDQGVLYFVASRERVGVDFDDDLIAMTQSSINGLRLIAAGGRIPAPLEDSPKCPRCSLVGICLPDEVNFLKRGSVPPRPLVVRREEAMPVYVQANRAKVAKKGEVLEITVEEKAINHARLNEVSQLVLMGNVYVTTPCLMELMKRGIPVTWHSYGGWFIGHSVGLGHKNVELRTAQYRASFDSGFCLRLAKTLVRAKITNARTLLRRNWRSPEPPTELLESLKGDLRRVSAVHSLDELLGVEGSAAARYFSAFGDLLKTDADHPNQVFDFTHRNRRPPTDPVNAMLSFAYTLLVRSWTVALSAVGLDPFRGFYHQPRYGRPALALDLMESFRPLVADSTVIKAVNNGEVRPSDFVHAGGGVALTPDGRKRFIAAFERRMAQEISHPVFSYRISYRRLLEVQARLLGRFLLGELDAYPELTPR